MKKLLTLFMALLLLCAPLSGIAEEVAAPVEEEKVLNIFTWATYIDEETILKPFTEETGIQVNYTTFSSNDEMLTKLQASGGADYDIVLASDYVIDISRKEGLLLPLDKAKIPNYENLYDNFLSQFYDPENEYSVPYIAGTPLIVYDPARVELDIKGYKDLWDPSLASQIVLPDDARNSIGITLKSLGYSFNTTDPAELEEARAKLMELRPNIAVLDYDSPHSHLISGAATVGYLMTPFVELALMERPDLKVVYPEEGMGFGIDACFIPVKAPHPDNAHKFLDFLLRPEIGAQIATVQLYRNVNEAAAPLLPESYYASPALNIPEELMGNFEFIEDVGPEVESLLQDYWVEFKQQ